MRAPILQFKRTSPTKQGLGYLQAPSSPDMFGADIFRALGNVGAALQERGNKVQRFQALTDFTEFETKMIGDLTELKRQTPPDVTDFPKQANDLYTKGYDEFSKGLPTRELQAEFAARGAELRQKIFVDSFDFQYKQQDALFRQGLSDAYEAGRTRVSQAPNDFDEVVADISTKLQASDLSMAEKFKLAHDFRAGLLAAQFGGYAEDVRKQASKAPPGYSESAQSVVAGLQARGLTDLEAAVFAGNVQEESGFRTWAYNEDEGAHGLVQWRMDRWTSLQEYAAKRGKDVRDPGVQMDFAMWEFQTKYPEAWAKFKSATTVEAKNEALWEYIRYDKASMGKRLENAKAIAGGADMQADVTAIDAGGLDDLMSDPRYATVSIEDKRAMLNAADQRADEETRERNAAASAAHKAFMDDFYLKLHDGLYDQSHIEQVRKEAGLTYDEVNKAEKILEDRQKVVLDATAFQEILNNNGVGYTQTMNGEKGKGYNAWLGTEGLNAIASMNDEYMSKSLGPAVATTGDIPTDAVAMLESMTRKSNPTEMLWAYNQLARLQEINRAAFDKRTADHNLASKVDQYRALHGPANGDSFISNDQLVEYLTGGKSEGAQAASTALREEANKILNRTGLNIYNKATNITWWWPDPDVSNLPEVEFAIENQTRELFTYNYMVTRDEDLAWDATKEQLQRRWASTTFGGGSKILMQYPVEKIYPPIGPDWAVYEDQVRRDMELLTDDTFQLISDQQTVSELEAWSGGRSKKLPGYRVRVFRGDTTLELDDRWSGDPNAP